MAGANRPVIAATLIAIDIAIDARLPAAHVPAGKCPVEGIDKISWQDFSKTPIVYHI